MFRTALLQQFIELFQIAMVALTRVGSSQVSNFSFLFCILGSKLLEESGPRIVELLSYLHRLLQMTF
jgi:hypothetical protein